MPLPIADATTEFVTLDEVKRHANIPDSNTAHDLELDLCRGAAQEHVESLIGPVLHRTVTETVSTCNGLIVLRVRPVVSVTSIVATSGSTLSGYTLDTIGVVSLAGVAESATVTYKAGRDSCPDAVRYATLIIAADLWDTQRGNAPSALPDADLPERTFVGQVPQTIPPRAQRLLNPYLLMSGIA